MKKLYWKTYTWFYWRIVAKLEWLFHGKNPQAASLQTGLTIGLVTFVARYEKFFQPFIRQLAAVFPHREIIVIANGYPDKERQDKYLASISAFVAQFPNVRLIPHHEPEGLSRLWNEIIRNASSDHVLIMNDDISITPLFRRQLENSGILESDLALINQTWSHFVIAKKTVASIGWFDERLEGVGNEDQDYDYRLIAAGKSAGNAWLKGIRNIVTDTPDSSYKAKTVTVNRKYSGINYEFLHRKWRIYEQKKNDLCLYSPKFNTWFEKEPLLPTPPFYPPPQPRNADPKSNSKKS